MAARVRSRWLQSNAGPNSYTTADEGLIGRTGASYTNEAKFDTNMVIILAALLCALICALGLNSILRCAVRYSRRIAAGGPAARLSAAGLKKSALRKIPVAVYKASEVNIPATECPICLGEFVDGERVRVLPRCNHGFHVKCIDTWLAAHSSCPTCRGSLVECSNGSGGSAGPHVELQVNAGS
uniref:RING-type E3 ubiquitin transferase n=1 Tax=Kalanchoe fedtschenkoi TaxID=63787 RepID=A0A7N0TJQ9_KALFE